MSMEMFNRARDHATGAIRDVGNSASGAIRDVGNSATDTAKNIQREIIANGAKQARELTREATAIKRGHDRQVALSRFGYLLLALSAVELVRYINNKRKENKNPISEIKFNKTMIKELEPVRKVNIQKGKRRRSEALRKIQKKLVERNNKLQQRSN